MVKVLLFCLFIFVNLNADYKDGEAIFKNKCSSCHGNFIAINTLKENFFEKNNIKITFFIVGDWAGKYPEAVKKISEAGHEIANHSNKHPHVNKLSYEENMKEIKECSEKIKEIILANDRY